MHTGGLFPISLSWGRQSRTNVPPTSNTVPSSGSLTCETGIEKGLSMAGLAPSGDFSPESGVEVSSGGTTVVTSIPSVESEFFNVCFVVFLWVFRGFSISAFSLWVSTVEGVSFVFSGSLTNFVGVGSEVVFRCDISPHCFDTDLASSLCGSALGMFVNRSFSQFMILILNKVLFALDLEQSELAHTTQNA